MRSDTFSSSGTFEVMFGGELVASGAFYVAYAELPMLITVLLVIAFIMFWCDDTFSDFSYAKHVRSKVISVG